VSFAFGVGIFGSTYIVPMFVQLVQGYTPTRCGLLLMPAGLVLAVVFPLAGQAGDRLPPAGGNSARSLRAYLGTLP
jgi:hypothetical protein